MSDEIETAPLKLPDVGGSWTLEELEEIAREAQARGVPPDVVALERRGALRQAQGEENVT